MDPAFPTTGSAVDQVLDGDYDIVQLSKKVDEVIKGLTSEESGGKGLKKTGKVKESDDELCECMHRYIIYVDLVADHDQLIMRNLRSKGVWMRPIDSTCTPFHSSSTSYLQSHKSVGSIGRLDYMR
jgi:hypothetical protein